MWIFCQNILYFKMEKMQCKVLRIAYQLDVSDCDLLEWNGSTSFHQQLMRFLLAEIYKNAVTTNPKFM